MAKKDTIIEPPVEDEFVPTFSDPPLTPRGDMPLDEKGHLAPERTIAKTFLERLGEIEEEEEWPE